MFLDEATVLTRSLIVDDAITIGLGTARPVLNSEPSGRHPPIAPLLREIGQRLHLNGRK